ncbi:hypothetical protein PF008_g5208 [Phytophthora fragariae]|uniref:Secreted protein n=1 Tax=Phytophthora fragariae TaxID=53985 RepID=A0A6G0S9P8_9STRA|nr:hypothetical protein PF008_g5208 [Phytophthora fragariae]
MTGAVGWSPYIITLHVLLRVAPGTPSSIWPQCSHRNLPRGWGRPTVLGYEWQLPHPYMYCKLQPRNTSVFHTNVMRTFTTTEATCTVPTTRPRNVNAEVHAIESSKTEVTHRHLRNTCHHHSCRVAAPARPPATSAVRR